MIKHTYPLFVGVIVLSAGSPEMMAQGLDQIQLHRGSPTSGVIVGMSPTKVTVDVRGSQRTYEVNEIRRIAFAEDPAELRRAREDVLSGQLENGLETLRRIDVTNISREMVRRDLQYYIAYCQGKLALSGGGDKAAAATALLEFVSQAPNSHHFLEAAELLGDLAVSLGSYDNAVRYYAAIGKAPWPEYKMRATALEAGALCAQAKFVDALAKYEGVLAFSVDTADAMRQKRFATVGKALCLAETGKPAEGISMLEDVVAKNDPQDNELFGRAYNAIGRCYLRTEQTKDALLAYLHVDVLFYTQPDVHAEALYHLSKLWTEVNRSDRSVEARNLLMDRYPGSMWAKRD